MKSVRWICAVVVAGVLALTGCSTPGSNVAGTVDGVSIPAARVNEAVDGLLQPGSQLNRSEASAAVLNYAIFGEVARRLADERGLLLTGDQRTALFTTNQNLEPLARFLGDPRMKNFLDDVIDVTLVSKSMGQPAFLQRVAASRVQINPRFGSWSVQQASVVPDGGQLSQPWLPPSPSATPRP